MIMLPTYIEVEISSYCNRTCFWCQNNKSSRGRNKSYIDDDLWVSLLEELQALNYRGRFAFHNYNEPLHDASLVQKISQVKKYLPFSYLAVYSNGDYLTLDMLERLIHSGLDELRITLYPQRAYEPCLDKIISFVGKFGIKVPSENTIYTEKRIETRLLLRGKMFFRIISPRIEDFDDRGGVLDSKYLKTTKYRTSPCLQPSVSASIDYLGNIKMCCQVYEASPSNSKYIIGNLRDNTFYYFWTSERYEYIRKKAKKAEFERLELCQQCSASERGHMKNSDRFNSQAIKKYQIDW